VWLGWGGIRVAVSTGERPQTYALDRAAIGTGIYNLNISDFELLMFPLPNFVCPSVVFCGCSLNLIIPKIGHLGGSLKPTYSVHVYFISPHPIPGGK